MADGSADLDTYNVIALRRDRPPGLAALYDRYWGELCIYVRRSFGAGPPEPEDVAQAAFTRYAAVQDKGSVENPRAFLYATARNIVIDHHRHARTADTYARDIGAYAEHEGVTEISPERVLLGKERLNRLLAFLGRMPERRRRVVLLNRMEGLSVAEVADRFGISEEAARKQIVRAVADCLAHLDDPSETKS